jgi:hypothetical protein
MAITQFAQFTLVYGCWKRVESSATICHILARFEGCGDHSRRRSVFRMSNQRWAIGTAIGGFLGVKKVVAENTQICHLEFRGCTLCLEQGGGRRAAEARRLDCDWSRWTHAKPQRHKGADAGRWAVTVVLTEKGASSNHQNERRRFRGIGLAHRKPHVIPRAGTGEPFVGCVQPSAQQSLSRAMRLIRKPDDRGTEPAPTSLSERA